MMSSLFETDINGWNALYYATYYGHLSVVRLLKNRQIPYAKDAKGTSCLHVACMKNHLSIVEFYL
jgi:ankyrin repeat protein